MGELTHADFARICAYIAADASKWAGDCLILPEDHSKRINPKTVDRFTEGLRRRLDYLDELARRSEGGNKP